jgi:hypothetical protein
LTRDCGGALPDAALSLIETKLAGTGSTAGAPIDPPERGYRRLLHADATGFQAKLSQQAYFTLIHASMPLRRWHGMLRRKRKEGLGNRKCESER